MFVNNCILHQKAEIYSGTWPCVIIRNRMYFHFLGKKMKKKTTNNPIRKKKIP